MKIGIDISQIVYEGTGVGKYVRRMVAELLEIDKKNEYVLFGASWRRRKELRKYFHDIYHENTRVRFVSVPIPPTLLELLWNRLHIIPVEWFTGPIDIFWSSDWTQPPLQSARGVTTIHDLVTFRYPNEMDKKITRTHKKRLHWVKSEHTTILCDSEATRKDLVSLAGIPANRVHVVYPGG